jgi:hypothetical protein
LPLGRVPDAHGDKGGRYARWVERFNAELPAQHDACIVLP